MNPDTLRSLQGIAALFQIVMASFSIGMILYALGVLRQVRAGMLVKLRAKDNALAKALGFLMAFRERVVFQGPADEDGLRILIGEVQDAFKL